MNKGKKILLMGMLSGTFILFSLIRMASAEKTTLNLLHMWWREAEIKVIEETLKKFQELHPDIRVEETRTSWADGHEDLLTAFMGGTLPDVFHMGSTWHVEFYELGMLEPLNKYLTPEQKEDIYESIWNFWIIDGDAVGVPIVTDPWGIAYRKDLFEKAGLNPDPEKFPETWGETMIYAMKLTKDLTGDGTPDQWGIGTYAIRSKLQWNWVPVMYMAGCDLLTKKNGEWVSTINTPEGLLGMRSWVDLIWRHKVMPKDVVSTDFSALLQDFTAGKYGMIWMGMFISGSLKTLSEMEGKWALAEYPKLTDERATLTSNHAYSMSKVSKHKKEAWMLLEFISNAENATKINIANDTVVPRKSQKDHPFYQQFYNIPRMRAVNYTKGHPLCPSWAEIMDKIYAPTVQSAMLGEISADEAVRIMDEEANKVLQE